MKSKIGIDTINFVLKMEGLKDRCDINRLELISPVGNPYGSAVLKGNSAEVKICLPKYLRATNVQPFTIVDMDIIDQIRNDVLNSLNVMGEVLCECRLTKIESNITQKVNEQSDCSQVLSLITVKFSVPPKA